MTFPRYVTSCTALGSRDPITAYISRNLRPQDFTVEEESYYLLPANSRTWNRREKIRKYTDNLDINREITLTAGATNVLHPPAVLFWRRLGCKTSAGDLLRLGTANRRDLAATATRVFISKYIYHWVILPGATCHNCNSRANLCIVSFQVLICGSLSELNNTIFCALVVIK